MKQSELDALTGAETDCLSITLTKADADLILEGLVVTSTPMYQKMMATYDKDLMFYHVHHDDLARIKSRMEQVVHCFDVAIKGESLK